MADGEETQLGPLEQKIIDLIESGHPDSHLQATKNSLDEASRILEAAEQVDLETLRLKVTV